VFFAIWSALAGCYDNGFAAVSTCPIYGWVDGCSAIKISGHGFEKDISATIGGNPVTNIEWPTGDLDQGYFVTGIVPASTNGKGYAEIVVTSGGKSSTLAGVDSYYYVECPAAAHIDSVSANNNVKAGDTITLAGCGLDPAAHLARFVDGDGVAQGADIPLTAACGTATMTLAAPTLPAGGYYLEIVNASGEVLNGAPCAAVDADDYCDPATMPAVDTADSAASCSDFRVYFGESCDYAQSYSGECQ
jgi:hypothetical protein